MAGDAKKLFVNIDIVFGSKKLNPQEMSADLVALQSQADHVAEDEKIYRQMIAADKKTLDVDVRAAYDAHAAKTNALRQDIANIDKDIAQKEAKLFKTQADLNTIEDLQINIKAKNQQIADEVVKLGGQVSQLEVAAKLVEADLKASQAKTQNWWYVFNGLLHLADRLMDKTNSDFSHYFGLAISIITNTITSMHALSIGLAASGPVGAMQAMIIVTSSLTSTASLVEAEANRQRLEQGKNDIGDTMFG